MTSQPNIALQRDASQASQPRALELARSGCKKHLARGVARENRIFLQPRWAPDEAS